MEVFRNFDQDAKDNAVFAATKLTMPVLVLGGEKSGGDFLITQGKTGRYQRRRRHRHRLGALAHRRGTRQVIPKLVEFWR